MNDGFLLNYAWFCVLPTIQIISTFIYISFFDPLPPPPSPHPCSPKPLPTLVPLPNRQLERRRITAPSGLKVNLIFTVHSSPRPFNAPSSWPLRPRHASFPSLLCVSLFHFPLCTILLYSLIPPLFTTSLSLVSYFPIILLYIPRSPRARVCVCLVHPRQHDGGDWRLTGDRCLSRCLEVLLLYCFVSSDVA